MDLSEVSTSKLKEISHSYQIKIDALKRELEEYQRKNYVIEEEINKRKLLENFKIRIEEDSKHKIERILSDGKKKVEPKKKDQEEEVDSRKDQEKKWTIDEMKKLLDKKGVKYASTLKKNDFIALIREHNGVREMNALHKSEK